MGGYARRRWRAGLLMHDGDNGWGWVGTAARRRLQPMLRTAQTANATGRTAAMSMPAQCKGGMLRRAAAALAAYGAMSMHAMSIRRHALMAGYGAASGQRRGGGCSGGDSCNGVPRAAAAWLNCCWLRAAWQMPLAQNEW